MIQPASDPESGLPAGEFAFVEMFCDEPGCDCRRVLFTVIDTTTGHCEAVINFGWEDAGFYAAWMREDDPQMAIELQGPTLHLGPSQGRHANAWLDFAKWFLRHDAAYVARVERHYAMFREDVEQRTAGRGRKPVNVGRNDACPCGSGRKFKRCCAANSRAAGADQ
jgi:hypothetical protein